MRLLTLFLLLILIFSCKDKDQERFEKECPEVFNYPGHFLKIPLQFSPHRMEYQVGDTLKISTIFSDSIEDISTLETYKIEDFPFKPLCLLYRFYDDLKWDAGFRVNEIRLDSIYQGDYNFSSEYADGFKARTAYKDNQYHFEFELVFNVPGRYIFLMSDQYEEHVGSGASQLNEEADAITFEGKCPFFNYGICNIVQSGDTHLDQFMRELKYLDDAVYRGNLRHITLPVADDPLGSGGINIEWTGFYAFEVEE